MAVIYPSFSGKGSRKADDPKETYDDVYFHGQLKILQLLLEHQLSMQALTTMRDMIAALGLIPAAKAKIHTSTGRDQRAKAEVFIQMLQGLSPYTPLRPAKPVACGPGSRAPRKA